MYSPHSPFMLDKNKILEHLNLKEGMIVADFGCGGLGYLTFPVSARIGRNGLIYAIDILKTNLSCIESKIKSDRVENIKTVLADIEQRHTLDIADEALDRILLVNTLFQINNHNSVFEIAVRLLKPSGQILVIDWQKKEHAFGPPSHHKIEKNNILKLSDKHQLKIVNDFEAGAHHYGIIFSK